jgi:hypothetical protein
LNKIEEALYQINENGDYVTSQELEVALRDKAPMSHSHREYMLKTQMPTIPTKTSDLINDSGFITESIDLSAYATRIELNELEEAVQYISEEADTKANKSDIPTKTSDLDNDSKYITETELNNKNYANKDYVISAINNAQLGGGSGDGPDIDLSIYATKDDLNNKADISDIPTVPTKVSAFTNDAGYVTESVVDNKISNAQLGNGGNSNVDLSDYATKVYVDQEIAAIELIPGPQGPAGADGTISFEELTEEQKASLKGDPGEKGDKGDSLTYEDLTPAQKADLTQGFVTCSAGITRIEVVSALPVPEEDGVLYIVKG